LGHIEWLSDLIGENYEDGVYLFGVIQNTTTVSKCGILYSLSASVGITAIGFMRKILKFVVDVKLRKDIYNLFIQPKLEYVNTRSAEEWIDILIELTNAAFGCGVILIDVETMRAYTSRRTYARNYVLVRKPGNIVEPVRAVNLKNFYRDMYNADSEIDKVNAGVLTSTFSIAELEPLIKLSTRQKKLITLLPKGTKSVAPNLAIVKGNNTKRIGYVWYVSGKGIYLPAELYIDILQSSNKDTEHTTTVENIPFDRLSWKLLVEYLKNAGTYVTGYVESRVSNTDDIPRVVAVIDDIGNVYFTFATVEDVTSTYTYKLDIIRWGYDPNEIYDIIYAAPNISAESSDSAVTINDHKSQTLLSKQAYDEKYIKYITYRHVLLILILSLRNDKDVKARESIISLLKLGKTTEGIKLTDDDEIKLNIVLYRKHMKDIELKNWDDIMKALMLEKFDFDNRLYYHLQKSSIKNAEVVETVRSLISPYIEFNNDEKIRDRHFQIYYDLDQYKTSKLIINPLWIGSTEEKIINQLANDIINPMLEVYFTTSIAIDLKKDPVWKDAVKTVLLNPGERLEIVTYK
jgi:hypothetical protein